MKEFNIYMAITIMLFLYGIIIHIAGNESGSNILISSGMFAIASVLNSKKTMD